MRGRFFRRHQHTGENHASGCAGHCAGCCQSCNLQGGGNVMTLDRLQTGGYGIIRAVGGDGGLRRRLLDMGLTPNTKVFVRKRAPLGDPLELFLRNYELTLRLEDAKKIQVEEVFPEC